MVTEGFAVMKCPNCRENIGIYYVMSLKNKEEKILSDTNFTCPHCNNHIVLEISKIAVEKFTDF
ncbi:MAG: hypothetical protein QW279_07285 [Candidatus Jordarchaeaceae archaeon]